MRRKFSLAVLPFLLVVLGSLPARAGKIALLLEEPYGHFGALNPTGHAAIYLSGVCAETPVKLRRCDPGERGVVISRYHQVDHYDWLAIPLLPYLYAVTEPDQIPEAASRDLAMRLRNQYRRDYLRKYVPDDPDGEIPKGDWTQLVGESYLRKIYGYSVETTPEQDDELIAMLNDHKNRRHFNLIFNNCANFAEKILNFYFPHSVHRNFIVDVGIMTPKQAARSFTKYAKRHPGLEMTTFVIPQVPGSIDRSSSVHGVLDSLLETKKYIVPLAILHPAVTGSLIAVYLSGGRYHPGAGIEDVFDPQQDMEPGAASEARGTVLAAESPGRNSAPAALAPDTNVNVSAMTYQYAAIHPSE